MCLQVVGCELPCPQYVVVYLGYPVGGKSRLLDLEATLHLLSSPAAPQPPTSPEQQSNSAMCELLTN